MRNRADLGSLGAATPREDEHFALAGAEPGPAGRGPARAGPLPWFPRSVPGPPGAARGVRTSASGCARARRRLDAGGAGGRAGAGPGSEGGYRGGGARWRGVTPFLSPRKDPVPGAHPKHFWGRNGDGGGGRGASRPRGQGRGSPRGDAPLPPLCSPHGRICVGRENEGLSITIRV